MDSLSIITVVLLAGVLSQGITAHAEGDNRDHTSFQAAAPYDPKLDVASDVVMVYGVNNSFPDRVTNWRKQGYSVSMMTGIAWGDYGAYYQTPEGLKVEEIQTTKTGRRYMHGNSKTVGYNVPSPEYVAFIKDHIDPAIDAGVRAIFFEEPEYWAETGWSDAFKAAWSARFGEPWQAPDSSVDAQYRASLLKYELYFDALRGVIAHVKQRAREKGITIECHVPTHSLINYAHWRIVSPESHLMDLPDMDGYIAQVWTGTARTPNVYRGVVQSRTFETAYFEYGQMLAMVRPTGRKVWFLTDPIEDNPNHGWDDYKLNYECTVIASLFWPEVSRYEVMPWPNRIFRGERPRTEADVKDGERVGIPANYATQILTIINALNDMDQTDVRYDAGTAGIGIIVSDTLMFQRAAPSPSDPALGGFYGIALPLLKHGIPAEVMQLETIETPESLTPFKVLFLTYEGQKPLSPQYHEALNQWVRAGGALVYLGDGSDPYNGVRAWWNKEGMTSSPPYEDLFKRLGVSAIAEHTPQPVGDGFVRVLRASPSALQQRADGADTIIGLTREMLRVRGETLETQHYLKLHRGPYVVASVLDESLSQADLRLTGNYIDLFDPQLPHVTERVLAPGERTLLYDLDWLANQGIEAKVTAAGARIRNERIDGEHLSFTARGPSETFGCARIRLPHAPASVESGGEQPVESRWDAASSTLWLRFQNEAREIEFAINWTPNPDDSISK